MDIPTVEQYQEVISNYLSPRQIEILQTIYHRPNSAATAIELAEDMGYKGYQASNRQIGAIGKIIFQTTGVEPPIYEDRGERYAYYLLVGEYDGPGWKLWDELKRHYPILILSEKKCRETSIQIDFRQKYCLLKNQSCTRREKLQKFLSIVTKEIARLEANV